MLSHLPSIRSLPSTLLHRTGRDDNVQDHRQDRVELAQPLPPLLHPGVSPVDGSPLQRLYVADLAYDGEVGEFKTPVS